jgi:hypothetical protein
MGGTGVSQLPKMFVPFAVLTNGRWWLPAEIRRLFRGTSIRCIYDYRLWSMMIDFSRPEEFQNDLVDLTVKVEQQCPVALAHGFEGIGEGIVWWAAPTEGFNVDGLVFKVKGEKHSETKVKTLAAVDVEKIGNIRELVATIATRHRMGKKLDGIAVDIRNTGAFLKVVTEDVMKEEADTIDASGLPKTDVMRGVAMAAKQFFMEQVNSVPL